MKKVIGNEIEVFLRTSAYSMSDLRGILVDVDDDSIYVQSFNMENPEIYIIPRDNIKYCTTTSIPSSNLAISHPEEPKEKEKPETIQQAKKEDTEPQYLSVYINKDLAARIPVTPTFRLNSWHDDIMKIVMGNPDVQLILTNRTLKDLEYSPGEVYIELSDENQIQLPKEAEDNSFSMMNGPGGNAATQFVSPAQMISRLNSAAKRGKKNDDETKM